MFKKFFDEFWPKAVEYVAEQGLNNVKNMKDFEHNLETLRKNLKLLSAKASDVEEEIKNGERSGRKKRKREVEEWLEDVRSIETEVDELGSQVELQGSVIMRLMDGGGKAAQLNMQVGTLVQQRLDFGEPVLDARGTREEILLTNGMVGEAFNENLETVLKLLEGREVSKIGVYGMGGVGKTTLATHVYNRLVQQSQGRVFWITVSQEFTVRSLQDKIARCLGADLFDEDEEVIRVGKLNRYFTQLKNSVLILDDLWERIDMSKVGCTFSAEGCRLIITTRSLEVCRQIGCKKLISVVKLYQDEAWKLLNETLENETELGPQVEKIAKSMTKLCGGLPLGIITVAGSMKGETAIHMWQNALAELEECVKGQDETGEVEEVFKVLKYSFDRLKRNAERESNGFNMIQHCFLYCSLYPEDYRIRRDDLVRKFISDGLLDERRSRRGQVVQGRSILDKLVNLCLLETCVDYDRKECVRMHDLVRSMALRICKGKYMVRAGEDSLTKIPNQEEWAMDLEKVSFMRCSHVEFIREGFSPDCPKLSTLLLWGNYRLSYIPGSFFCKMQGLCTLDLGGNNELRWLPNSVSDLTSLKSLLLKDCYELEEMPYLGKMKALRELNLSGTSIKEAPGGLEELLNLRFLSMYARGLKMLPRGLLLKLGHLEHLNIPLDIQISTEEIENLKRLEELSGGVKSVSDFNKFVKSGVHDPCYRIRVSKNAVKLAIWERGWPNNNELGLLKCDLKDEKVLAKGVVYLTISNCEGMSKWLVDDLSARFDNPTSLKELEIERCGGVEWIMRSGDAQTSQLSTTLEQIHLEGLDDLKGMMEREEIPIPIGAASVVFSSLIGLKIVKCNKMRRLRLQGSIVPNLKYLYIESCREIQQIFEEGEDEGIPVASKLTRLRLISLPRLGKVGLPASRVPNLESITIESCKEIQEIFEQEDEKRDFATTLSELTELKLKNLPRLRKVGLPASGVPNLMSIEIKGCEEIQEIFEDKDEDEDDDEDEGIAAASTLPKLELMELCELKLYDLPRLRKVGLPTSRVPNLGVIIIKSYGEIQEIFEDENEDEGIAAASTLHKLEHLGLYNLPRLRKVGLPASGVHNLAWIEIKGCGEIQEIFEDEDEGIAAASTLPKLEHLELYDLPRLRKVGLPASGVPNLESIEIKGCEEIQEIFEDEGIAAASTLPKLEQLGLYNLPRLRKVGLPASGVRKLECIKIKGCEEIQEIFEDEGIATASTLPKLEHLELYDLPRLRKVGLPASGVPKLEWIKIKGCEEIPEIFEDEGIATTSTFPKLEHLGLYDLPRLKRVNKATIISNSIELINIGKCPRLMNKLPLRFGDPVPSPLLEKIKVEREWWESLEWDHPHLPQLLQPFLHFKDEDEDDEEDGDE